MMGSQPENAAKPLPVRRSHLHTTTKSFSHEDPPFSASGTLLF